MIYYNDIDPVKTEWLKALIANGSIPAGIVDQSDIWDLQPNQLKDHHQCHFFAGIGVWASALKKAGWTNENVWTASLPCQPFSQAGKGEGFADERHLWPAFFHNVELVRPEVVLGEQVASPDGQAWFDVVSFELAQIGYDVGAVIASAAGFGAPMRSERLYWMATARSPRCEGWCVLFDQEPSQRQAWQGSLIGRLATPNGRNSSPQRKQSSGQHRQQQENLSALPSDGGRGPTNGFWRSADWLRCTDGKWRPVEPSSFPLAHGIVGRVGLQRGYGDAIVEPQAVAFAEAALEWYHGSN